MTYLPKDDRYQNMTYRKCGNTGLYLPTFSLGLWHNFGDVDDFENSRMMIRKAFDLGITHFDLANNYGCPPGSSEANFGKILKQDLSKYRDQIIISTKAGYKMWDGPYGDWGSKKSLVASIDQSLKRMDVDYVDVFYHHREDKNTPLEETMATLDLFVKQGKALYVGLSNYSKNELNKATSILKKLGTPFLIYQPSYSMLNREIENDTLNLLKNKGIGCIVFSPLAGGRLTNKYLNGIPLDSRAANKNSKFLNESDITEELLIKIRKLNEIAENRGQKLSQMALSWILRKEEITSVLIGASKPEQIEECVAANKNLIFMEDELNLIDEILK